MNNTLTALIATVRELTRPRWPYYPHAFRPPQEVILGQWQGKPIRWPRKVDNWPELGEADVEGHPFPLSRLAESTATLDPGALKSAWRACLAIARDLEVSGVRLREAGRAEIERLCAEAQALMVSGMVQTPESDWLPLVPLSAVAQLIESVPVQPEKARLIANALILSTSPSASFYVSTDSTWGKCISFTLWDNGSNALSVRCSLVATLCPGLFVTIGAGSPWRPPVKEGYIRTGGGAMLNLSVLAPTPFDAVALYDAMASFLQFLRGLREDLDWIGRRWSPD